MDPTAFPRIPHARYSDYVFVGRLQLPSSSCNPRMTYGAKNVPVSRLEHSLIRSSPQFLVPETFPWSGYFCNVLISLEGVKGCQTRKLRLLPYVYHSDILHKRTQICSGDIIFGSHADNSLIGKTNLKSRNTPLETTMNSNRNHNSSNKRKQITSSSSTYSWNIKSGIALESWPGLHFLPLLAWWQSAMPGFLQHFVVLVCLYFLHSGIFQLNEVSALAEEMHRPSLYLDSSNITVSEDRYKEFILESTPTLRNGDGIALNQQATENKHLGVDLTTSNVMQMFTVSENTVLCEETYGIFPCSNSLMGNLVLMFAYGYLLLKAAQFISEGSELLLKVMNPGLIGGLVLPILGALPDAVLVLASGAFDSIDEAQQEVQVGIGVLAGSTIMLLTLAWAGSLAAGRCDLSGPNKTAKDMTLTQGFNLFHTGVTTDKQTRWGALIMMVSAVPYLCAQVPALDGHPGQGPVSALAGFVLADLGVFIYCVYQVASPWLQKKQIEEARLQLLRSSALQGIASYSSEIVTPSALLLQEGTAGQSKELLRDIFARFDKNKDGKIAGDELQGLVLGLNMEKSNIPPKEYLETWLDELDLDDDGMLAETEFLLGIQKWARRVGKQKKASKLAQLKKSIAGSNQDFWDAKLDEAKETLSLLESEIDSGGDDLENSNGENPVVEASKVYQKAALFLVSGAALATCFADPLIDSIQGFSAASRIPPFFVAFIVVPFASNASELLSSILFAKKRRKRSISLTFSQIYGAVTMNNTLCLGIFLGLVYARGLTWDFSSEATIILANILCVGLIGFSRTTFPLWYAIPVFFLYFVSIGGVAFLDYFLGWH